RATARARLPARTTRPTAAPAEPGSRCKPLRLASALVHLGDPGSLDRLEDLFAAALRIVVEAGQRHHPVIEVGEAHLLRVDIRMRFGQLDRNVLSISPLHK